jgi:hypothetical protein
MNAKEQLKSVRSQIKPLAVKSDLSDDEAKTLQDLMAQAVKLESQVEAQEQAAKAEAEEQAESDKAINEKVDAAVKAEKVKWKPKPRKVAGCRLVMRLTPPSLPIPGNLTDSKLPTWP